MPDPDTLTDMAKAATRIADAIERRETIAIFGDYDVDGATSTAVLAKFLRHCGLEPLIHIPDRLFEGYGPNAEAIGKLAEEGATLLVTVDCGTSSHAPIAQARAIGLDVIIIDHHQADEALPPALAVLNPNRLDDLSSLAHLAAVGLVFMTLVALNRELRRRGFWSLQRGEPDLLGFLDLVALGTVADVVPLKGLNRAFVAKGLLAMRRAVEGLIQKPDFILVDARRIPHCATPQRGIIKGDTLSASIAAASIIAKTTRDAIMTEMDSLLPGYNFATHKGYPTPEHCRCLKELGATAIHRRSFARVREALGLDPIQDNLFPEEKAEAAAN
jgi:hypothetical protein